MVSTKEIRRREWFMGLSLESWIIPISGCYYTKLCRFITTNVNVILCKAKLFMFYNV